MVNQKLKFEPVRFDSKSLVLIDQRKLPGKFVSIRLRNVKQVWHAIRDMVVRGAPAIGVTAAYGAYLGVMRENFKTQEEFFDQLKSTCQYLKTARPTAVNLAWALDRILTVASNSREKSTHALKALVLREAISIHKEDIATCFSIGRYGAPLIREGDSVLTHCNAGGLATTGYGTALSPLFEAKRSGKRFHVFADETRPLLQGARLTMWELKQYDIPATLICDNMAGSLMRKGLISKVITGADRIVRNGDTANKIGTYSVACLANAHGIPFYVAAPISTFDFSKNQGVEIPIEERSSHEVTHVHRHRTAPENVHVYNPAFDVTPHQLITAFITEKGIIKPPFSKNFQKLK
ncbi:MAG: S-methyl-5-thioribose-1-phosphate isomerase [Candidatus Omnitrophica bacterium]|nr:S-methyl-5-thioribose-1-phosphate isomerase [Candidatus Omnitrophota bacterium]